MNVKIRPLRRGEIKQLERLWKALYLDPDVEEDIVVNEENMKRWREKLIVAHEKDENQIQIQVAGINGERVGYIYFYNPINERFGFKTQHYFGGIIELYVKPEFRRRGIATQLIQRCANYLRTKGAEDVRVDVLMQNQKALNLYQKLGFKNWVAILRKTLQ